MMSKVKKILKWFGIVVGLIILIIIFYLLTGLSKPNTKIDYTLKVNEDTHLVEVSMTIKPNKFIFLDLFLNQTRSKDANIRVRNFDVTKNNKKISHWKTIPTFSPLERIWVGFNNEPITITYTIDPFVEMGDRGKAISFLSDNYGYFRGMYIIYTPITFSEGKAFLFNDAMPKSQQGIGSVQFQLPEDWKINDPWENMEGVSIAELRNTYWGLGKDIEVIRFKDISIGIVKEMDKAVQEVTSQNIEKIYNEIEMITGISTEKESSFWAISILPPIPIHGGVAGSYSLLTEDDISIICHEMFHWWNGNLIESANDVNWFKEGFTTYYQGKILLKTGIWSEDDFNQYIQNLISELNKDGQTPINLIAASSRLTNHSSSMEDYYEVYNGGALLAYYIDRELKKDSKTLDQIWAMLYDLDKVITNEDFIDRLKNISDTAFADQIWEMIEGKRAIPLN